MKKNLLFILLFAGIILHGYSQKLGLGIGGIYNFRTKSIGYDLRLHWQVSPRWAFVPQYNRFPSFNKIFEDYWGMDIDFTILLKNPEIYLLAGVEKNNWFNYIEFHNTYAKPESITEEAGLGLRWAINCHIYPYVEARYNAYWQEINARAGIIFFFLGCNHNNRFGGMRKRGRSSVRCPAYRD